MAILNERIKQRREELGISQIELAKLLGYSDRSTIAKIERGTNDITQSKIEAFAKALHTTPAYLMGWENDPQQLDFGWTVDELAEWLDVDRQLVESVLEDMGQPDTANPEILSKVSAEVTRRERTAIPDAASLKQLFEMFRNMSDKDLQTISEIMEQAKPPLLPVLPPSTGVKGYTGSSKLKKATDGE